LIAAPLGYCCTTATSESLAADSLAGWPVRHQQ
jgi:hypothetical protein